MSVNPDERLASIGTHHATPSFETFEPLIELATSRVLARLPPGSVQPAATAGLGEPTGVLPAWPAAAAFEKQLAVLELLVLQPPAARLATISRVTPATVGRLTKHLIRLIPYVVGGRPGVVVRPRKLRWPGLVPVRG